MNLVEDVLTRRPRPASARLRSRERSPRLVVAPGIEQPAVRRADRLQAQRAHLAEVAGLRAAAIGSPPGPF